MYIRLKLRTVLREINQITSYPLCIEVQSNVLLVRVCIICIRRHFGIYLRRGIHTRINLAKLLYSISCCTAQGKVRLQ